MFKKILVPIDIAEQAIAEPAVVLAGELAALANGAVRLIHVLPELPYNLRELLPGQTNIDRENAADAVLQALARKANIKVGRFTQCLRTGAVYHEVLAEAEAWAADLIIVGSHNPSMSTYLLGSNAQKIVRHANCSVLVARPHKSPHGAYWLVPEIVS